MTKLHFPIILQKKLSQAPNRNRKTLKCLKAIFVVYLNRFWLLIGKDKKINPPIQQTNCPSNRNKVF